jgi:uncharacterized protein
MLITRRDFLTTTASVGAGLWLAARGVAETSTTSETATDFAPPGEFKVKYYGRFSELPVGSVKPAGWIKGWLDRQLQGLTGHPENLGYPYDTCMYAGKIPSPTVRHGENWWPYEQSAYFLDGSVRLSFLLNDPAAQTHPSAAMNYIVTHSTPGSIGESVWNWPNAVVGRALIAQYSATANPASVQILMNCLLNAHIGGGRDGFLAEEALYLYGLTADPRLLAIAKNACDRFFLTDPRSFSLTSKIQSDKPLREHGVTAAEQLKLLPLLYSYTGDPQLLELATLAYNKVVTDSLMPDGGIVSSESMNTTAFTSLHETCDITDWSWSFGYMLMASGEGKWADLIERATFNALPGAVTKDFKQLQYFSSANQILVSNTACPRIAMTRMSYRAAHETECCSGNVNRAMPNYVTRIWMRSDDGLAAVLYGPSELHTTLHGHPVTITQQTDYPFRDTITFTISLPQPYSFSLHLRIPDWCDKPILTLNGQPLPITAAPGAFATLTREFHDRDTLTLRLPMQVAMENWFDNQAAVLRRGPLVYSLQITEHRVESMQEPAAIRRVLKGNNVQGFPAVEFFPQSEWRYGLPASLKTTFDKIQIKESSMPDNPFLAGTAPIRLVAPLHTLPQWLPDWKPILDPAPTDLKQSPKNPAMLPASADLRSPGQEEMVALLPYGCTHLRLTTFPVIGTEN